MKQRTLRLNILFSISLGIILLDQLSKFFALTFLKEGISQTIIPNLIKVRLIRNSGAAFSLLSGNALFLGFLSLIVTIFIIIWLWQNSPLTYWKGLSASFILGGTIGNGIDRFRVGFVTDFLELIPIDFPIFNIADISINIAIICWLIEIARKKMKLIK